MGILHAHSPCAAAALSPEKLWGGGACQQNGFASRVGGASECERRPWLLFGSSDWADVEVVSPPSPQFRALPVGMCPVSWSLRVELKTAEAKRSNERRQVHCSGPPVPCSGPPVYCSGPPVYCSGPLGQCNLPPWEVCIGRDRILMNGPEKDDSAGPETRETAKSAKMRCSLKLVKLNTFS